ncbi:hypothetical protein EYZ11_010302 [Aspergillus tanneri]|uniref:Uncharacterized protein n=1 Tax=Aspergillus tanneri TaxID=1220188 RepID=A0A4S3JB36_9EURO|nr:hypothetical protein EYZ11_010302 [Aspergillus tanneri]
MSVDISGPFRWLKMIEGMQGDRSVIKYVIHCYLHNSYGVG